MIVIDSVNYESYLEICKAYEIDFKEFLNYKRQNPEISEWDLLAHFLGNVGVCMEDGSYFIRNSL